MPWVLVTGEFYTTPLYRHGFSVLRTALAIPLSFRSERRMERAASKAVDSASPARTGPQSGLVNRLPVGCSGSDDALRTAHATAP